MAGDVSNAGQGAGASHLGTAKTLGAGFGGRTIRPKPAAFRASVDGVRFFSAAGRPRRHSLRVLKTGQGLLTLIQHWADTFETREKCQEVLNKACHDALEKLDSKRRPKAESKKDWSRTAFFALLGAGELPSRSFRSSSRDDVRLVGLVDVLVGAQCQMLVRVHGAESVRRAVWTGLPKLRRRNPTMQRRGAARDLTSIGL